MGSPRVKTFNVPIRSSSWLLSRLTESHNNVYQLARGDLRIGLLERAFVVRSITTAMHPIIGQCPAEDVRRTGYLAG